MLNLNQPQGSVGTSPQLDGTGLTNPANWQSLLGVASALDSRRRSFAGGQPGIAFPGNIGAGCWIPIPLSGQVLGTGDFTVWARFRVTTTTGATVFSITDAGNNWFGLVCANTYSFDKSIAGAASNTPLTGMGTAQAGQVVDFVVVRSAGVLTYYLNGVQLGNTDATAGWNWSSSAIFKVGGYFTPSQNFNDRIYRAVLFNRALSAQDVADLVVNGVADADQWGTQTPPWPSNFSVGTDSVIAQAGTSAGNIDSIGSPSTNDTYRFTIDGTTNVHSSTKTGILTVGKRFRLSGQVFIPNAQTNITQVQFQDSGSLVIGSNNYPKAATWTSLVTTEFVARGTNIIIYWMNGAAYSYAGNSADVGYLNGILVERIGALVDLNLGEGAGQCFTDRSTNLLHGIPIGGLASISHVVPGREGCVRVHTTAGGGIQLGGSNPVIPLNARIRCITADAVSGTPTVTMGSGSGGTQHVASVALTAGLNDLTVVNRFNTTGNLWVNVSVTATVDWTVIYDLVD